MQKLKGDLNASSLKKTKFMDNVIGLSDRVHKLDKDIKLVLSKGLVKVVDTFFSDSSFWDAKRDL